MCSRFCISCFYIKSHYLIDTYLGHVYGSHMDTELRNRLAAMLPTVFPLRELDTLTNGLLKVNNVYQVMHKHPELRTSFPKRKLGGKTVLNRNEFIKWLEKYYGTFSERKCGAVMRRAVRTDKSGAGNYSCEAQGVTGTGGGSETNPDYGDEQSADAERQV